MKILAYIYQFNELENGHSIFDKRLSTALQKIYGEDFHSGQYDLQKNKLTNVIDKQVFNNENTVVILSHYNTFKIAGWFKKSKVVFINHDLPYYAYFLQKNPVGFLKGLYSWLYIHYYWRKAAFIFFISKYELNKSGINKKKSAHIKVGIRPGNKLSSFSILRPVAVFTGNYKWSLKSMGLYDAFAKKYDGHMQLIAVNIDSAFLHIAETTGVKIMYYETYPTFQGITAGIITDHFLSGFKLKVLELILSGCYILSYSDIKSEFEGIIHSDLFINVITELNEIDLIYKKLLLEPDVTTKYEQFYTDVCEKFNWDQTAITIKDSISKF